MSIQRLPEHADSLLTEYYAWERINKPGAKGYPPETPFRRIMGMQDGLKSIHITDDLAIVVDGVLARLRDRYKNEWEAVQCYYSSNGNVSKVAKNLGKNRRIAEDEIIRGVIFIDGGLFG